MLINLGRQFRRLSDITARVRYRSHTRLRGEWPCLHPDDYVICVRNKFIFTHIPKTAGKSMRRALFDRTSPACHATAEELSRYFPNRGTAYFRFAFVRNPWDRLVSSYYYLLAGGNQSETDKTMAKELLGASKDFNDFVETRLTTKVSQNYTMLRPQNSFIYAGDELLVDFVGRFERLDEDFSTVAEKLGYPAPLQKTNVSSKRNIRHYRDIYSSGTRDRVGEIYADDIQLFEYVF